jgi:glycosyltransferase involved in cell wall biosynthesis
MKMIFVGASGDRYGADAVLRSLAAHFQRAGVATTLLLPEEGPGRIEAEADGLDVSVTPTVVLRKADLNARGLLRTGIHALPRLLAHTRTIRAHEPNVVWVNTITLPLWMIAARLARRPVICHTHEIVGGSISLRRVLYSTLFLADRVVTVSQAARADIVDSYPSLAERVAVALNPSFSVTKPVPVRPGAEQDIVVIGRISARKGFGVLMDALGHPSISELRPVVHVCGTAYNSPTALAFAAKMVERAKSVSADVRFHGYVPTEQALAMGAIVAVPSTEPEACPLVIAEAMAAGRSVVASKIGGIPELSSGATVLIPPGDADALGEALAKLVRGGAVRESWRARGLLRAAELSRQRYFAQIERLVGGLRSRDSVGRPSARANSYAAHDPQT